MFGLSPSPRVPTAAATSPIPKSPTPATAGHRAIIGAPAVDLSNQRLYQTDDGLGITSNMPLPSLRDAIIPFSLTPAEALLQQPSTQGGGKNERVGPTSATTGAALSLGKEQVAKLQLDCLDYVDHLDSTLRDLFAHDNLRLHRTLIDMADVPNTFQFLRLQQKMMRLSGDHSIQRDRGNLARLAELLDA